MYETELQRLQRKRDQAWECAGCARRDGDVKDEARWLEEARKYTEQIQEIRNMDDVTESMILKELREE